VVCATEALKHLHSTLNFPEWVDVKPYEINTTGSRRLLRLLGASKTGNTTYMKPCSLLGPTLVHPPPFQDYLITYTDGNEVDITETLHDAEHRPTSRARTADADVALPVRVARRTLVRASYLAQFPDDELSHMASTMLAKRGIDGQHPHSKLMGNRIYYESGEMFFHCYSNKCPRPLKLGFWARQLDHLLHADMWDHPQR